MALEYIRRIGKTLFGLLLCSMGSLLNIQANIGLAPWDALSIGVSKVSGISYGVVTVWIGVAILGLDLLLKEKIGVGTLLNTVLIGLMVDVLQSFHLVPLLQNFWLGVPVLLLGQALIALGSYFYISPGLGCGPRDSLMVAMGRRFSMLPIGLVRGVIEGTVLVIGWLLGAKVGLGTVISVFGISFLIQWIFRLFRFDATKLRHESIFVTGKRLFGRREKKALDYDQLIGS
ncbi:MAG: hypothetical protein PHD67_07925 [Oscillospiraceae bacterium]|nr:hypothetical protein [Oscillospiraceae bacterium]